MVFTVIISSSHIPALLTCAVRTGGIIKRNKAALDGGMRLRVGPGAERCIRVRVRQASERVLLYLTGYSSHGKSCDVLKKTDVISLWFAIATLLCVFLIFLYLPKIV